VDKAFRIRVAIEAARGKDIEKLAKKYNVDPDKVVRWAIKYVGYDEEGKATKRNSHFPVEFRKRVAREWLAGKASCARLGVKYGMSSCNPRLWAIKYYPEEVPFREGYTRKYGEEFKRKVLEERNEGATSMALCKKYNVHHSTLIEWVRERGTQPQKHTRRTKEFKDMIVKKYNAGASPTVLASKYGFHHTYPNKWKKKGYG